MLIKDTIPFIDNMAALPQSADPHLEQQGISITMPHRQQLYIHNIYIPPRSSCSAGHNASIAHLLSNNELSLIVGDINAHHSRWDTNTNEDERGEQLTDEIATAKYIILNENEATWLPTNGRSTLPYISLASNDIKLLSDWSVSTSLLKKKAGSPNSARRARSDSCIRQCGPSTTARLCLQHKHTLNNPSLALQLYAEQTSQIVHFRQKESKSRKMKTGVVQGGVLSPALFNYYLADFPTPPPNIKLIKYADDITIYTSGHVVADLINCFNIYLLQVLNYINNKKLTVSTAKSTVTLFTPDTHEHHLHPQVKLADKVLPRKKKPKVLGATLDTQLTFTQHCNNIAVKVQQCNNVLKALAGSTWG